MTFAYLILGIGIGYISSKVNDKREKIKKIHSTISVYTPSFIKSWYETIKTVVKIQLDGFYNDVQDNVIKRVKTARKITPCLLDNFEKREIHEIDYYFKGKKYKFHFDYKDFSILKDEKIKMVSKIHNPRLGTAPIF